MFYTSRKTWFWRKYYIHTFFVPFIEPKGCSLDKEKNSANSFSIVNDRLK